MHHFIVYTDGSCHTQCLAGAWAALVITATGHTMLTGTEAGTTHNRMELQAVIAAIKHITTENAAIGGITVYTDSQYVAGLVNREAKLEARQYTTRKGTPIRNAGLVAELLQLCSAWPVTLNKVKAHQARTGQPNYNTEVDKVCRQLVRGAVSKME